MGATIKGIVTNNDTSDPLPGSHIKVSGASHIHIADLEGKYHVKGLSDGTYTLTAYAEGFLPSDPISITIINDSIYIVNFSLTPKYRDLEGVHVKSKIDRESDKAAIRDEKNSDNIINVMSAQKMQLLPDITVANVLQRVSGVTVERTSTGDGRYAIIRGMDQRYNYTLVNGVKIPSPDNKYRYVPMDMFPSELLERLEVVKALTPSMEGDATGGAMNLIMKSAPDSLYISGNASTGMSQMIMDRGYSQFDVNSIALKSPAQSHGTEYHATPSDFNYTNFNYHTIYPLNKMAGLSIGNRFLKKRLGVMLGGSYQDVYRGSSSMFFVPNSEPGPGNVPRFDDQLLREYSTRTVRTGVHAKIDYNFNRSHSISLYTVYMKMDEMQTRETIDTSLSLGRNGVGTGNVFLFSRSRYQQQSIYNSTLQGSHYLAPTFKVNWSAVYSIAKNNVPDWSEMETTNTVTKDSITPTTLKDMNRRWLSNTDRDLTGYLNFTYTPTLFGMPVEFMAGGLYRDKLRQNAYHEYVLTAVSVGGIQPTFDGNLGPEDYKFLSAQASMGSPVNPNTYTSKEHIIAAYGQLKFELQNKLQILGGIRAEHTYQSFETVMPPTYALGRAGTISYLDLLPSLHLRYRLNKKQNLRASYYKSICRPGFHEIIPYTINTGETFPEGGNPYLKHSVANNFDLRYELFPRGTEQLLIGVFYKNIQNPIEYSVVKSGTSSLLSKPQNFGTAKIFGAEFTALKYWGNFGVSLNYTYIHSEITTNKLYAYKDQNGNLVTKTDTTQTRPLQGQSPHLANISLLYKNRDKGLDLQIALVYTGKKIILVSGYLGLDYWQRGFAQLDFSAEKKIGKKFSVYCKVNNILNSPVIVEILQPNVYKTGPYALSNQKRDDRILVQEDYYKQNYLIGLRYKF
jgi:outer membrane receptor protein involved in Fe transport